MKAKIHLIVFHKEKIVLTCSTALMIASLFFVLYIIQFAETRSGMLLSDPIHPLFPPPVDWSLGIFAATHSAIFMSVIISLTEGLNRFSFMATCYGVVTFLRGLSILLIPLEPPTDMILLVDPIFNFFNPDQFVATKDLFFSGHCSTLFLFYLIAKKRWFKQLLMFLTVFVTIAILWQRVHYTIDVIGGIFIAWGVVSCVEILFKKWKLSA